MSRKTASVLGGLICSGILLVSFEPSRDGVGALHAMMLEAPDAGGTDGEQANSAESYALCSMARALRNALRLGPREFAWLGVEPTESSAIAETTIAFCEAHHSEVLAALEEFHAKQQAAFRAA